MMGVYDLRSMYSMTEELWFPEWDLKGTPWQNPEGYAKQSPSSYVAEVQDPDARHHGPEGLPRPLHAVARVLHRPAEDGRPVAPHRLRERGATGPAGTTWSSTTPPTSTGSTSTSAAPPLRTTRRRSWRTTSSGRRRTEEGRGEEEAPKRAEVGRARHRSGRPAEEQPVRERTEEPRAVGVAEHRLGGALGVGHEADDVPLAVADARDVVEGAVRVRAGGAAPRRRRSSGRRPGRASSRRRRSRPRRRQFPSPWAIGRRRTSPFVSSAVNGVRIVSTRTKTSSQRKRWPELRRSAPGRRPASQRTWKPLQMPRTAPPFAAKSRTASMTGEKRARAPQRR